MRKRLLKWGKFSQKKKKSLEIIAVTHIKDFRSCFISVGRRKEVKWESKKEKPKNLGRYHRQETLWQRKGRSPGTQVDHVFQLYTHASNP